MPSQQISPAASRTACALVVGGLAVVFDTTIVSVALHTLAHTFDVSVETVQWVSAAYLLSLGVTIPVVGWAQRRVGGKRLWLCALTIFLLGSLLCSLAWNVGSLVAFRAVQGVGGGLMLPLMATMIVQAAGGQHLGRMMSTISLPVVLGPILGPVIGGLILGHLSWPWLFWVNVPFCVVGLVLAAWLIPRDPPVQPAALDSVGLLLLSPAVVGLLYGLSNAARSGGFGRADVLVPLLGALLLLAAFLLWAWRQGHRALVNVRLFRHRPLSTSALLLFLSGFSLYGSMLLLPLYFQEIRGTDALGAGLLLIPQGIGTFLSRAAAGQLADRIGPRWVTVAGFAIVTLSTLPFAFAGRHTSVPLLMAALLVRGLGLGAVTIPLMACAFTGLERAEVPEASIVTRISTQVGGSFGTAVLAVILSGAARSTVTASAFQDSFWWATGLSAAALLASLLLPEQVRTGPAQPTALHGKT